MKRLSPEDRRKQLLKAAIYCYGEMGVERAGHGDVAKSVGVSTATVFNYFPTRELLTEAVFKEIYSAIAQMNAEVPKLESSRREQCTVMAEAFTQLIDQNPDLLKAALNWSTSFGPSVRPAFLKFQDWILNGIANQLEISDDENVDARIILAVAISYAQMKLDNTPQDVLSRFIARILKGF